MTLHLVVKIRLKLKTLSLIKTIFGNQILTADPTTLFVTVFNIYDYAMQGNGTQ
jgi:hypothetical protein